ncbi:MAG TPA: nitronate monooxygenase [Caulobacteraceae bacterium]
MKPVERARAFCERYGLKIPILMAPMGGASPPALAAAVTEAGGLGACGVVVMSPAQIDQWAADFRTMSGGPFQLNAWVHDPPPDRVPHHEERVRAFLGAWGPPVPPEAGDATPAPFEDQARAMLAARPNAISSVMGLFPPWLIDELKARRIPWFAHVSTLSEARAAEHAGADVIVAQGGEAGGHRGAFDAWDDERRQAGLMALLPAIADAVRTPVVAAGGIADGRGVAAALALGAHAVAIGTGLLRSPEAGIDPAWADGLARAAPEDTLVSRVFSGRAGRSLATAYVLAATAPDAPAPAPYPVQRGLTAAMRRAGAGDLDRIQAWAGQSAGLARAAPAGQIVREAWEGARALLA